MKRILAIILIALILMTSLTGCSKEDETDSVEQTANFEPEATSILESASDEEEDAAESEEALPDAVDVLVDADGSDDAEEADDSEEAEDSLSDSDSDDSTASSESTVAPTSTASAFNYNFTTLTDTSFGFTFTYPVTWENLPGKYTVCFREVVEDGDVPARVAITVKELAHKPSSSSTVLKQFKSYAKVIYNQYDSETFEFGDLNSEATFLGEDAFEIYYLAYSGDIEVEGYMICCAVESSIYVFHFSASREDFEALESTMIRMRDSITLVD